MKNFRLKAAAAACLVMNGGAFAEPLVSQLSLDPRNGEIQSGLGGGNSVLFTRPQPTTGSVLVTRSTSPILCASSIGAVAVASPAVAVDPNGYLPEFPLGDLDSEALSGDFDLDAILGLESFPEGALFRTAQRLQFDDMLYPVPPDFVVVSDIAANCFIGLAQASPLPPAPTCSVLPDSFEADRINRGGFELSGQLELQSRIIDSTPSGLYYEHVITAVGAPVYAVQFREQFPYRTSTPGQARFKDSMAIDSAWTCRASAGAQCNSNSLSDAGLGYAHLDSASLDAGACLRIIALRETDSSGLIDDDFSGSLHGALIYPSHGQGGVGVLSAQQSRINFD